MVSAGITRLYRADLPGPFGMFIALLIELEGLERALPHEVLVIVRGPSGTQVAEVRGALQLQPDASAQLDSDEMVLVALPLDLRQAGIAEYGWHVVTITGDDEPLDTMRVKVARPPQPSSGAGPTGFNVPKARRPH